ncbi:MAG: hypothetical protein ACTSPY_10810 [Candidatus Helarchaeota archaeon]
MNKKSMLFLFGLLFCMVFQIYFIIPSNAQIVNLWGVSAGASRSFDYYEIYSGTINTIETHPRRTYSVVKIYDSDNNNYTELLLQISTLNTWGLPDISTQLLNDEASSWTNNNLIMDHTTYSTKNPLYPIVYNDTDSKGFNWTAALEYYNTAVANWNMSIYNNIATLNMSNNGTENGADYDVEIIITWDISSGWLISFDEIKTYNATLGYSIHYQTVIYNPSGALSIDLNTVFAIIAISLGCVAIIFSIIVYKKYKSY